MNRRVPKGKTMDTTLGATCDDERRENTGESEFARNARVQATERRLGLSCTHTRDFKHWREQQINDDEIETNQLIIRLDRLISNAPKDPVDRKAYEREIVPWCSDDDFPLCAFCRNRFTMVRRRHHCRTCGVVLCKECSLFVTFLSARKLVNPAVAAGYDVPLESSNGNDDALSTSSDSTRSSELQRRMVRKASKFLTSAAMQIGRHAEADALSVGSYVSQEGDSHLRVCPKCKQLLERRDATMSMRLSPPIIVSFYERLHQLIDELSCMYPSYCRTANSLNAGESLYTLEDGKTMKIKVIRLQEQIDAISRKIQTYGVPAAGEESREYIAPPPQRQLLLQKNIRNYATTIVRDIIMCMPQLPDRQTYERLRTEYRRNLDRRIDREKSSAIRASPLLMSPIAKVVSPSNKATTRVVADGWTAETKVLPRIVSSNPFENADDDPLQPLKEQIVIIRSILRQAAEAGRIDEVQMLEKNLCELEEELDRQEKGLMERSDTYDQ